MQKLKSSLIWGVTLFWLGGSSGLLEPGSPPSRIQHGQSPHQRVPDFKGNHLSWTRLAGAPAGLLYGSVLTQGIDGN